MRPLHFSCLVVAVTFTLVTPAFSQETTHGLFAEYFNSNSLTDRLVTRVEANVNYDWAESAPMTQVPVDNFSVCWSGYVVPEYSEAYTFTTTTDDGVRLWVNHELLVNSWAGQSATPHSGTTSTTLTAGTEYPITMEYFEKTGNASAILAWSSASQASEVIPQEHLVPGAGIGDRAKDWLYNPVTGHNYRLTGGQTWEQCQAQALAWNGHLVTINDAAENSWISENFAGCDSDFFIGANDKASEGVWVWDETGENFFTGDATSGVVTAGYYCNWASGEPNNANSTENAGVFYRATGMWNDLTNARIRHGMVETSDPKINWSGPYAACQTIAEGKSWQCWVNIHHAQETVLLQWYRDGVAIPGATSDTLTLTSVEESDNASYHCVLTYDGGVPAVATSTLSLTVLPLAEMPVSGTGLALLGLALCGAAIRAARRSVRAR